MPSLIDEQGTPGAKTPGMPSHVGLIMDGNGRWAASRGLPRIEGHRRGLEALRKIVRAAIEVRLDYLTVYSFSKENWTRPFEEIQDLLARHKDVEYEVTTEMSDHLALGNHTARARRSGSEGHGYGAACVAHAPLAAADADDTTVAVAGDGASAAAA